MGDPLEHWPTEQKAMHTEVGPREIEPDKQSVVPAVIVSALIGLAGVAYLVYSYMKVSKSYENEVVARKTLETNYLDYVNHLRGAIIQCGTNEGDFLIIYGMKFKKIVEQGIEKK